MIIPSIDIQGGRAVQLKQGHEFVLDGGDPLKRLEEFAVVGEVAVIDLDAAVGRGSNAALIREMCRRHTIRVGGGIRTHEAAANWLDAGAERIIVGTAATEMFCSALPTDRVIAAVDAVHGEVVVDGWRTKTGEKAIDRMRRLAPYVGGFLLTQVEWEGRLSGFDLALVQKALAASDGVRITAAGGIRSAADVAELDALGADAQVGMALYTGRMTLGQAVSSVLVRPVDDRFWPTVVVDQNGYSLGLVWSTAESIESAVRERKGIYWSRSRDELWEKGATSGHTQHLTSVEVDCDRDALRFTVHQSGVFCHKGTPSCWGSRFTVSGLENTLSDRARMSLHESGTSRLLHDADLLRDKLIEEAGELAAASGPDDVMHEAADVMYFLMVCLARAGVSFENVVSELCRRNKRLRRRPMASKVGSVKPIGPKGVFSENDSEVQP